MAPSVHIHVSAWSFLTAWFAPEWLRDALRAALTSPPSAASRPSVAASRSAPFDDLTPLPRGIGPDSEEGEAPLDPGYFDGEQRERVESLFESGRVGPRGFRRG